MGAGLPHLAALHLALHAPVLVRHKLLHRARQLQDALLVALQQSAVLLQQLQVARQAVRLVLLQRATDQAVQVCQAAVQWDSTPSACS